MSSDAHEHEACVVDVRCAHVHVLIRWNACPGTFPQTSKTDCFTLHRIVHVEIPLVVIVARLTELEPMELIKSASNSAK